MKGMHYKNKKSKAEIKDGFMSHSKALGSVLPSPAILESYWEIDPNIVPELIEMVKKEQVHRHNLEKKHLKSQAYTTRIGQLLAFALSIIVLYTTFVFAAEDRYLFASFIAILGFSFLISINFVPGIAERLNKNTALKRKIRDTISKGNLINKKTKAKAKNHNS